MKKLLIILTILLSLSLVACSKDNTSTKAVEDGKIALVSKEYDKAKDLFKLAANEDSKNTEAKSLLDLTSNYMELLDTIENGEFDKADNLISKIEKNNKLDIIKEVFIETKNNIIENKAKYDKYIKEIESIEKLLSENEIDEAKSQAKEKLEDVKGIKSLEDRLNTVIKKVDEIISNAKAKILKYYKGNYDIKYENMEYFSNNSEVKELKGKAILNFYEDHQLGSPYEYIYRIEDGEVFRLDQGEYYWVSNNNKLIYRPKEIEEAYAQLEALEKENNTAAKVTISSEKAKEIVTNYLLSNYPEYTANFNDIVDIGEADNSFLEEFNVYYIPVTNKTNTNFKVNDYFVDATTGEVRLNLTY